jgi:hypothetical protein
MDVFKSFPAGYKSPSNTKGKRTIVGRREMITRSSSDKPFRSTREIRDKVEKIQAKKAQEKSQLRSRQIKGRKMGMSYMEADAPVGDVGLNDPNDPMTREKLKSLLGSGAVNFGDKERAVLAKILNK